MPTLDTDVNPFADLLPPAPADNELIGGGTPDAPAFQSVNGKVSDVPVGVAVSANDYGPFHDLVSTGPEMAPASNYAEQFGEFADLIPPSLTPETDAVQNDLQQRVDAIMADRTQRSTTSGLSGFMRGLDLSTIPRDVLMNLAGPLPQGIEDLHATYDWLKGNKTFTEAFPQSQEFVGIEKKPLEERIKTGFNTLIQLGFLKAGTETLPTGVPKVAEPVTETATVQPQVPRTAQPGENLGGEGGGIRPGEQGAQAAGADQAQAQEVTNDWTQATAEPVIPPPEPAAKPTSIEQRISQPTAGSEPRIEGGENLSPAELDFGNARLVKSSMLSAAKNPEIFDSIVQSIPVDVMDVLSGGKIPAEVLRHDPAMFANLLSASEDLTIDRSRIGAFLRDRMTSLGAKPSSSIGRGTLETSFANSADVGNHRVVSGPSAESRLTDPVLTDLGTESPPVGMTGVSPDQVSASKTGDLNHPVEATEGSEQVKSKAEKDTSSPDQRLGIAPPGTAQIQRAIESTKIPRGRTELDAATSARSAKLQQSFAEAERAQAEIKKPAPTERERNAMSIYREAGGDKTLLQQQIAQAKSAWFKKAAEDALALTPEQIAMTGKVGQTFDILERRGNRYGVLTAHRDNYVPHVWDVENKGTGFGSARLKDRFKFNKARTFDTFFDGDQAGFKPKTLDISKLLPAYMHEMNTVVADRQFVQDVSSAKGTDQVPLVAPRGNAKTVDTSEYAVQMPGAKRATRVFDDVADAKNFAQNLPGSTVVKRPSTAAIVNPRGFVPMKDAEGNPIDTSSHVILGDQPALHNWRWVETDPQGNTTILKGDLAVHPELAKRLNAMMGQSAIRKWYNEPATKGFSTIPKAIAKNLDTAQAVMKREMFGLLAPFHQVQEGTHAVGHTVNPFFGLEDMSRPTPAHVDAMQHGLMLLPEKGSGSRYIEGVGGRNTFIAQIAEKFGGRTGAAVADTINGYQDYLFHQYIPALKFKTYEHILERNMTRFAPELKSGEVTRGDVKQMSAEQTNAAYGHLNYALLDRDPTMHHFAQLTLLAPDFLEARARFVGQAIKGLAGGKVGREQLRAIAVLALAQAGSAYTLSRLIPGGKWDPEHPFELVVNNRSYTLRSVPEDLFRLFFSGADVRREFVRARENPFLQSGIQATTGKNYRGEKTDFMQTMGELLANYIPITARAIPALRNLTESGRNNPVSPLQQLAGSLGVRVSRYSPVTKTFQLANQWQKDQGLPQDRGVYPVSKYQQLRYALEDGDLNKANQEFAKLKASGMKPGKIRSGFEESLFHPFTGTDKTDVQFKKSLAPGDRLLFDEAVRRRKQIWQLMHQVR